MKRSWGVDMIKKAFVTAVALIALSVVVVGCVPPVGGGGGDGGSGTDDGDGGGGTGGGTGGSGTYASEVVISGGRVDSTSIRLDWDEPSDADFESVEITYGDSGLVTVPAGVSFGWITSGIELDKEVEFLVRAVASDGRKSDGVTISLTPRAVQDGDIFFIPDADTLLQVMQTIGEMGASPAYGLEDYYIVTADIDMTAVEPYEWIPIGDSTDWFRGTFDGANHSIANLVIDRPAEDEVGFFGRAQNAGVLQLSLDGLSVTGKDYVGGVAGFAQGGDAIEVSIDGVISGERYIGGIFGLAQFVIDIANSNVAGTVSGTTLAVGGLVGRAWDRCTISSSFSTADVAGNEATGGLVGSNNSSTITESYATGVVSGANDTGGLVGFGQGNTIETSYATGNVSGTDDTGGLVGNQDLDSEISDSYSTGQVSGRFDTGGLVGDQDRSSIILRSYATGPVDGEAATGGLVGQNYDSVIENSYATGAVTGEDDSGGLAGDNFNGAEIVGSWATGSVTGTSNNTGGLVGSSTLGSSITNSYATGVVDGNGTSNDVGGLVGENSGATVTRSYATGSVTGGGRNTGGLVGVNSNGASILESFATGDVQGVEWSGGLAGSNQNDSSIAESYASGDVSDDGWYTGGLVGYHLGTSTTTNTYATGLVSGGGLHTGSLIGYNSTTVTNSYALQQTGVTLVDGGTGTEPGSAVLSASAMATQGSFPSWDFAGSDVDGTDDYWSIDPTINGGRPYLTNNAPPE